jgi:hypothetical protein
VEGNRSRQAPGWFEHQHGTGGLANHALGHAAHDETANSTSSVRSHHDQIGVNLPGYQQDLDSRVSDSDVQLMPDVSDGFSARHSCEPRLGSGFHFFEG